jgi:hypothetical protein
MQEWDRGGLSADGQEENVHRDWEELGNASEDHKNTDAQVDYPTV